MSEQSLLKEENLLIIKEIEVSPSITQRHLSNKLGMSLGKTNYLLKELIKKGFVEIENFSVGQDKMKKIRYLLTKEGLEHKMELMQHFLRAREIEYYRLKQEWETLVNGTVKQAK